MAKRDRKCQRCDGPMPDHAKPRAKYCGVECSVAALRDQNEQLRAKQGPHYDRWRKAMRRTARGL